IRRHLITRGIGRRRRNTQRGYGHERDASMSRDGTRWETMEPPIRHRQTGAEGARPSEGGTTLSNANAMVNAIAVGVVLAALGFWGFCLVDFTRTDESEMRTFSK